MLPLCDQLFVFRIEWHSYCPLWKRKGLLPTSGQYPHRCPSSHEGNAPDPPPSIKAENDNNIPQKDPQKATKVSQVAWPVTCTIINQQQTMLLLPSLYITGSGIQVQSLQMLLPTDGFGSDSKPFYMALAWLLLQG